MSAAPDLGEVKRRLAPRLLRIKGVSGVGVRGGVLVVYLKRDAAAIRREVATILEGDAPGVRVDYIVTGEFHPHRPDDS